MKTKRFVVVGLGNFGSIGHDVAALDRDPDRVDQMGRLVARAAVGDSTDPRTLRRLGAEDADAAIVSTGDDITASAMTTLAFADLVGETSSRGSRAGDSSFTK